MGLRKINITPGIILGVTKSVLDLHEEDPKLGFWNLVQEGNERRVLMTEEHYKSLLSMLAEGKISKWKKGTELSPVTASAVLHS